MLRRGSPWLLGGLAVLLGVLLAVERPLRADTPGQVNFQARLTDATGKPLPDGTVAKLTFVMFKEAAAVTSLWGEIHTNVPISRGVVSVQLGNGAQTLNLDGSTTAGANPLSASLFDGNTRWLQIKVNDDPALSPLVALVSVPYALSAGSINGQTAADMSAPVGTVLDWIPPTPTSQPPSSWRVCDGSVVNGEPTSPFNGRVLPNFVGHVARGISAASAASLPAGTYATGGQDSFTIDVSHSHGIGSHTHSIPQHSHHVSGTTDGPNANSDTTPIFTFVDHNPSGFDKHTHNFSANTDLSPAQQTGPASGSTDTASLVRTVDTTPSYVGVVKIIKIK